MNPELDAQLVAKYPKIFADRYEDPTKTAMCFGFECGDGWYNIIDALCEEIQRCLDYDSDLEQVVAFQVKEKYGSLRFYTNTGNDVIYALIDLAETLSERTCEVCGAPGKSRGGGWIRTLCDEHAE